VGEIVDFSFGYVDATVEAQTQALLNNAAAINNPSQPGIQSGIRRWPLWFLGSTRRLMEKLRQARRVAVQV